MEETFVLPSHWGLPALFRQRLGKTVGRQRAMTAEGHLLILLHRLPETPDQPRRGMAFWRNPAGLWESTRKTGGLDGLKKHIQQLDDILLRYSEAVDRAGAMDDYFAIQEMERLVTATANGLHEALQQAREMIPGDSDLIDLRDRAGDLAQQANQIFGEARDRMNLAIARRAEQQAESARLMARSAHRLNMLAALFFPVMTLSTIFGMNLPSGLENARTPALFLLTLAGGLAVGFLLLKFVVLAPDRTGAAPGAQPDKMSGRQLKEDQQRYRGTE